VNRKELVEAVGDGRRAVSETHKSLASLANVVVEQVRVR